MLKLIPRLLSPELMKTIMEMGHGDEIVLADANFPAASYGRRVIYCCGSTMPEILDALLRFFPLDRAVEFPVYSMDVAEGMERPPIFEEYRSVIDRYESLPELGFLSRFDFYERASRAHAIIVTGECRRFSNLILKKGIVLPESAAGGKAGSS